MSIKLIDNAKEVLLKAWSVRFAVLAALFSAVEVALPFFEPLGLVPPRTMAVLALVASAGAALARLVAQPKTLGDDK